MVLSPPPGEGDPDFYGAFASRIGAGAAKAGKKVAQSEAGRSATKAAVKGATDAATKDLTDRYTKRGDYATPPVSSSQPTSASKPPPVSAAVQSSYKSPPVSAAVKSSYKPPPVSVAVKSYDSDEEGCIHSPESYEETRRLPPKPSVFQRFKPTVNLKSSKSSKPKPTTRRYSGKRIYNHRLAKQPDWDRLAQAVALYNFRGEMKCDLEFRKGQVIDIMCRTDSQNDWWEGKLADRVGIFPANYVRLL